MALVHENLCRSEDLARVDFDKYLRNLGEALAGAYGSRANGVGLRIIGHGLRLSVDSAIPCGLIVNELVTNALKHAFPDGRRGEITVGLDSDGDRLRLTVVDNGAGFPADLDLAGDATLGLQLVHSLVEQLDGRLTIYHEHGTAFAVTFADAAAD